MEARSIFLSLSLDIGLDLTGLGMRRAHIRFVDVDFLYNSLWWFHDQPHQAPFSEISDEIFIFFIFWTLFVSLNLFILFFFFIIIRRKML